MRNLIIETISNISKDVYYGVTFSIKNGFYAAFHPRISLKELRNQRFHDCHNNKKPLTLTELILTPLVKYSVLTSPLTASLFYLSCN